MKKFNVMRCTMEVHDINDVETGCCIYAADTCPDVLGEFDTEEEAISLFANYDASVHRYNAKDWEVTEVWIEEAEYDEDGDMVMVDDVYISTDLAEAKLDAMMGYEIPDVEVDMETTINDIWSEAGETPKDTIRYKVTSDTDLIVKFEVIDPDEDDELDSKIRITEMEME